MTGQVIVISVGQAGNQVAEKFWEKIAQEHNIGFNGLPVSDEINGSPHVFFNQIGDKYVPRGILVDLEPAVVSSAKEQKPDFYDPNNIVHGTDGAGNNFAVGHTSMGNQYIDKVISVIEKNVSQVKTLGGFIVTHSVGGGTGAGFGTLIMQKIKEIYPKIPLVSFSIYPSPRISDVLTEPYNALLSTYRLVQDTNATVVLDNDAIYKIAQSLGIADPTYSDLNAIISQVMVNLTAGMRYSGTKNLDLRKIVTNMVPHPRLHFLIASSSPVNTVNRFESPTPDVIAQELFDQDNVLAEVDFENGAFISASVLMRGLVNPADMDTSLRGIKDNLKFVPWIPTGFQTGLSSGVPLQYDFAGAMLANHTGVTQVLKRIINQFDKLWSRKAFAHWYTDAGLSEEEILTARDDIEKLVSEYEATLGSTKVEVQEETIAVQPAEG